MTKIFLLVLVFFTLSCANVIPPTGGPKDIEPPVLISSNPKVSELNFNGKRIDLIFDEDIDASTILTNLIITPYMEDNPYKPIVRKNRLILEFEKPLEENTTYTFNFGESIKDVTEGNIARNIIIPFSTGPDIDTGRISGNVTELLTGLPAKDYVISLYASTDTLNPKNSKPLYFAKTDPEGKFFLQNVREDSFHVYAINDKNKNLQWDEGERIGFVKSVNAVKNESLEIEAFDYDEKAPYIKSTKFYIDKTELNFSEGLEDYKLSNGELISTLSENGNVITVYKSKELTDTLKVIVQVTDSSGNSSKDTADIFYTKKDKTEIKPGLSIAVEPQTYKIRPGELDIELKFNKPVTESRIEKIYYYTDSTKKEFTEQNFAWTNSASLQINSKVKAQDSVTLVIPEKSFISLDTFNQETTFKLTFLQEENFGIIRGKVTTDKENYILQLLNNRYEVVEEIKNPLTFNFEFIAPGIYFLRIILDENNNGKWDQGNPFTFDQPETVILHPTKIDLRANWEISDINFVIKEQ